MGTDSRQLLLSVCSCQLKKMYDSSKKASNEQEYVLRMLGSSIKLSLLSNMDKQSTTPKIPRVIKNIVKLGQNKAKIERKYAG